MTPPGSPGAPLEADALLLDRQPHREDDLFVRLLVRDVGVVGLHVPRGRTPRRQSAATLQAFSLGRVRADARRMLRAFEPLPALGASRLARDPRRFWAASLLGEALLPLPPDVAEGPLFEGWWATFLALHLDAPLSLERRLIAALGALLGYAGVRGPADACGACGAPLGPGAWLDREGSFRCAACYQRAEPGPWSPALLATLEGAAGGDASGDEGGDAQAALTDLIGLTQAYLGRELRSWPGLRGLL